MRIVNVVHPFMTNYRWLFVAGAVGEFELSVPVISELQEQFQRLYWLCQWSRQCRAVREVVLTVPLISALQEQCQCHWSWHWEEGPEFVLTVPVIQCCKNSAICFTDNASDIGIEGSVPEKRLYLPCQWSRRRRSSFKGCTDCASDICIEGTVPEKKLYWMCQWSHHCISSARGCTDRASDLDVTERSGAEVVLTKPVILAF